MSLVVRPTLNLRIAIQEKECEPTALAAGLEVRRFKLLTLYPMLWTIDLHFALKREWTSLIDYDFETRG
jgi:hypothetical protein